MKNASEFSPNYETEKLRILKDNKDDFFRTEILNDNLNEASKSEMPKKLFGEIWFENELCILFGDTSSGKSILAMQIADAISKGHDAVLDLHIESDSRKVLYLDFELSPKQREIRYSNKETGELYTFNQNLIISDLNNIIVPEGYSFEVFFIEKLSELIFSWDAKIIIIDNITFISDDLVKGNKALQLMKLLKSLAKKLNVSILLLAHVPKRDALLPITKNDLSGSKNIANFADSIFALGVSVHNENMRYVKQIKERVVERKYGFNNVIKCQIVKENNFLGFEFLDFVTEQNMLMNKKEADLHNRRDEVKKLHGEGLSYRDIAKRVGVSHNQISKDLKK